MVGELILVGSIGLVILFLLVKVLLIVALVLMLKRCADTNACMHGAVRKRARFLGPNR